MKLVGPYTIIVIAMMMLALTAPKATMAAPPAAGSTGAATKIATASPARIFNEIQETKDLKALIESKTKSLEQDRFAKEQKLKELKALRDQLKPDAPQYADRDRDLRQAAIDYKVWFDSNTADMQAEQKRQMLLIFNKILSAVQEVATAKGIDLVIAEQKPDFPPTLDQIDANNLRMMINSQNVLFSTPQVDISTDVITAMDAKYKSGK
jgi:Skp family chaperone for outer membrane proteins